MNRIFLGGTALVALLGAASVAYCASVEPQIAPQSTAFADEGYTLLGSRDAEDAILRFETALAVDPKNVDAYVGLARAHRMLGLPGRAVKFYREGLTIDPANLTALQEQGEALLERGAVSRAEDNLSRLRELCEGECAEAAALAAAIQAGPPEMVADAESATEAENQPLN